MTAALRWSDLDGLRLRYYAPRRKKATGWMALTLRAGPRRLSLDSTLPEFEQVAVRAIGAARRNGVELDDITVGNLAALELAAAPAAERL